MRIHDAIAAAPVSELPAITTSPPSMPRPLLLEIGSAMLLTQHLVSGEPLPDAYVREVVDEIIVPLARPDAGRRPRRPSGLARRGPAS